MKHRLIFAMLATFSQFYGAIFEVAHFDEILTHIDQESIILLDIDDTLLIPKQMLGCDEWFYQRWEEQKKEMPFKASLEKTLAEWEAIRHLTQMEIVEKGSDEIVKGMQDAGFCVMGLTTQGLALATRTSQQLNEQGLDLTRTAPSNTDCCVSVNGHTVLYRNGVLFTSGTSKGISLFNFCEKIGVAPKRIVFINDKRSHLEDIQGVAEARGVPFVGLRYAYSDARKKAFDPKVAECQFTQSNFGHILSDEEAREMLGGVQ